MDDFKRIRVVKAFSLQPQTVELLKKLESDYKTNQSKFVDMAIQEKANKALNNRIIGETEPNDTQN